ncbi:CmpA/NrtA family ABC transporter substrate-binding protein [Methylobacterium sp. J-068]|uniref:CmpA/NrtA family ABC transporter substrate-binding protein n=1 Tax=Methylobacterium sp. J-068 TaxID=2836649 RepID=UPI001FBB041E|nr:CmpA/NrtA family ABC transporter substrate-binding protein [Methylobacterium sp. J-068]MCJ2036514.1 ABC transporter substrate-binding protein [Methylobacterium sp. J-068]
MRLALGYVPLIDAAALLVAVQCGFTAAEGLSVDLVREPSWATLRDKLALGHLDGAHMLAPLAIASALGISGPETDLAIPLGLSLNGNAVTLARPLWAAMAPEADDLDTVARAFARVATARAGQGRPLTLGTVHPFSSHTYQLRLFAARGGLDLDAMTRLVVIPPPWIAEALRTEQVDGFCVGAPWNSVAVTEGYGRIAAFGCELAPDCPEKVLALPAYAAPGSAPLVRAVRRAGLWCAAPENHRELASLLAHPDHLGLDPALVRRALEGTVVVAPDGTARRAERFVVFGAQAERPEPARADWLLDRMGEAGQIVPTPALAARARAIYRPDLYEAALAD